MIDRYLSPAELKRLLSALLVVATFIVICLFFAFMVVPGMRNVNNRVEDPAVNAPQGEMGWLDPTTYPAEKGRVIPPIDPATVMTPNPELLARGKTLYAQSCASCHGAEGRGDGAAGLGLNPKPRNLAAGEGWKHGTRATDVFKTLAEGIKGSSMVAYSYLSKKDRMALVHHVQSLATFPKAPEDPKAQEALAKLFASAGEVVPNRIPLTQAQSLLLSETPATRSLRVDPESPLRTVITDAPRAAQILALSTGWKDSDLALAKAVVGSLPANGFSPLVATFGPGDWKTLRGNLIDALK